MTTEKTRRNLEELAARLGYTVVPANENRCKVAVKTILLNPRQSEATQVFALAHELGHAKTLKSCDKRFGGLTRAGNDRSWSTLESEFRAWAYADSLMIKFGLYNKDYLKFKHASLSSYYRLE